MTESEWLASADPQAMVAEVIRRGVSCASDRKLRLFSASCWRYRSRNYAEPNLVICDLAEKWADGDRAKYAYLNNVPRTFYVPLRDSAAEAAWEMTVGRGRPESLPQADLLRDIIGNPFRPVTLPNGDGEHEWHLRMGLNCCRKCGTVQRRDGANGRCRGVVGVEVRSWLTPTALSLAEAAYQERGDDGTLDPVRLSILADALEEAGCDNEDILMHLRGMEKRPKKFCFTCGCRVWTPGRKQGGVRMTWCAGCGANGPYEADALETEWHPSRSPHVRGCWAVDLIRGKE